MPGWDADNVWLHDLRTGAFLRPSGNVTLGLGFIFFLRFAFFDGALVFGPLKSA